MSKLRGDSARAHRIRKQNIARRAKIRDLRQKLDLAASAALLKIEPAKI
jgi:hypothetical protein